MNDEKISTDDNDIEALLPWYVNGTLSSEEQAAVEELLNRSERAQRELAFLRAIATEAKSEARPPASEFGWRRLQKTIKSEATVDRRNWWKPGLAAAAMAIATLQVGLLVQNYNQMEGTRLLSDSPVIASGDYWLVQVLFTDDSQWQSLVTLIEEAEATVVDGPSSLGLVRLAVDKDNELFPSSADLLLWLEQQPQVTHVALEKE
ncbi:MAG: hypothetical protein WDZ30_04525 [Cellvibrionaceae bacterium]